MKIVIHNKFQAVARNKETGFLSYESAVDTIENILKDGCYKYHKENPKYDVVINLVK